MKYKMDAKCSDSSTGECFRFKEHSQHLVITPLLNIMSKYNLTHTFIYLKLGVRSNIICPTCIVVTLIDTSYGIVHLALAVVDLYWRY